MLKEKLAKYSIILASESPRRKQFFTDLGLDFEVRIKSVEETYPAHLKGAEIADYLACLKATAFHGDLNANAILITSDTVVWCNGISLAKAAHTAEAVKMLQTLSGQWHEVITAVCFTTFDAQVVKNHTTHVKFKDLTKAEIDYYVTTYQPFDKAGAYGIQEWIGLIGIEEIKGSYTNVVGLPTHLVYNTLLEMTGN